MQARNYYGFSGWRGKKWDGSIESQFATMMGPEPELVYAVYSTPSYEGHASVIYRQAGQWFEAGGGHCSCYGLEDQWTPEPIDPSQHLQALESGRSILLVADSEGDYPEATQTAFNEWLRWAVTQP